MTWFGFGVSIFAGAAIGLFIWRIVAEIFGYFDDEDVPQGAIGIIPYRREKENTPPRVDFLKLMIEEDVRKEMEHRG